MDSARTDTPSEPADSLFESAWRLRWRAPELALAFGERSKEQAERVGDTARRLRAEALVLFALNQLGQGVQATERALAALREVEAHSDGSENGGEYRELAARLRLELARCSRAANAPMTGFALLRPVLDAPDTPPLLRAASLVQITDFLAQLGHGSELSAALVEADRLYLTDESGDQDAVVLLRSLLRAVAASHHRRWNDLQGAVRLAEEGLELLGLLSEPGADSGHVAAKLSLELVCAHLDSDRPDLAVTAAEKVLVGSVRAPAASALGWIRLALATRVHLPEGRLDSARDLLVQTADSAERHRLDSLLAQSLTTVSHLLERTGELPEALNALRSAHAAERRRERSVQLVRVLLAEEFAALRADSAPAAEQIAAMFGASAPASRPATVQQQFVVPPSISAPQPIAEQQAPVTEPEPPVPAEVAPTQIVHVAPAESTPSLAELVTGVPALDRLEFRQRTDSVLADASPQRTITLLLMSIDHFVLGADAASPEVMAAVRQRILEQLHSAPTPQANGPQTMFGVLGEELLAVLLPDVTAEQAHDWAQDQRIEVLGTDWSQMASGLSVTVRVGTADSPGGAGSFDLFERAERSLFPAPATADAPELPPFSFSVSEILKRDMAFSEVMKRDSPMPPPPAKAEELAREGHPEESPIVHTDRSVREQLAESIALPRQSPVPVESVETERPAPEISRPLIEDVPLTAEQAGGPSHDESADEVNQAGSHSLAENSHSLVELEAVPDQHDDVVSAQVMDASTAPQRAVGTDGLPVADPGPRVPEEAPSERTDPNHARADYLSEPMFRSAQNSSSWLANRLPEPPDQQQVPEQQAPAAQQAPLAIFESSEGYQGPTGSAVVPVVDAPIGVGGALTALVSKPPMEPTGQPNQADPVAEQPAPIEATEVPATEPEQPKAPANENLTTPRGVRRSLQDVGLADLLTEALVAYEDGRRKQAGEPQNPEPGPERSLAERSGVHPVIGPPQETAMVPRAVAEAQMTTVTPAADKPKDRPANGHATQVGGGMPLPPWSSLSTQLVRPQVPPKAPGEEAANKAGRNGHG
ncbi:hypothetical protein D5S17_22290 [Pseudonocardiaceae bacterium YIM PH 21723]|nr:hypothetical protein D5S17_22290 [Pseudonocardiaceae bacterium YIM PH 21723]